MKIIDKIKDNRNLAIGIGIGVLILIIAIIVLIVELNKFTMPDLEGLKPEEAKNILLENDVEPDSIQFSCNSERINNINVSKFTIKNQNPKAGERVSKSQNFSMEMNDLNKCKENLEKLKDLNLDKAMSEIENFNKKAATSFSATMKNYDSKDVTTSLIGKDAKELAKWKVLAVDSIQINDCKVNLSIDTIANIQKRKAEEEAKRKAEEAKQKAEEEKEKAKKEIENSVGSTAYDFQQKCDSLGWKVTYSEICYCKNDMKTGEPFSDGKRHWTVSNEEKRSYSDLLKDGCWEGYNAEDDEGVYGIDGHTFDLKSTIFVLCINEIDTSSKTVNVYTNLEKQDITDYYEDHPEARNAKLVVNKSDLR